MGPPAANLEQAVRLGRARRRRYPPHGGFGGQCSVPATATPEEPTIWGLPEAGGTVVGQRVPSSRSRPMRVTDTRSGARPHDTAGGRDEDSAETGWAKIGRGQLHPPPRIPILGVPATAMAINGYRNKPIGPGGSARRLHQILPSWRRSGGRNRIDKGVKGRLLLGMVPPISGHPNSCQRQLCSGRDRCVMRR